MLLASVVLLFGYASTPQEKPLSLDEPWRGEDTWPEYIQNNPIKVAQDDSVKARLLKERYNVCLDELRHRYAYWEMGKCELQDLLDNIHRLEDARRSLPVTAGDPALGTQLLEFAKYIETLSDPILRPVQDEMNIASQKSARAFRLSVEIQQMEE